MEKDVRTLKALADENRLRLLLLLGQRELFVCQLMAILGISQPLVSRSLALLDREGLLESRRSGKQVFYRLKQRPAAPGRGRAGGPAGGGRLFRPRSPEFGIVLPASSSAARGLRHGHGEEIHRF